MLGLVITSQITGEILKLTFFVPFSFSSVSKIYLSFFLPHNLHIFNTSKKEITPQFLHITTFQKTETVKDLFDWL